MENFSFRRIAKFKFDNKTYEMFKTNDKRIAFLEIKQNKYFYPKLEDFEKLVALFAIGDNKKAFYNENHKLYRFFPKVETKKGVVLITSAMIFSILTGCSSPQYNDYSSYSASYYQVPVSTDEYQSPYDDIEEESDILEGVEIRESKDFYETEDFEVMHSIKSIELYNNKYFTELFEVESYSLEELIDVIKQNKSLPDSFKEFYIDYVKDLYTAYPNLDFRVFYHNMKTLEFEMRDAEEISFDTDTVAYYDTDNNKITVSSNIDIKNNIKDKIIVRHELGHTFNIFKMEKDGWKIRYSFRDLSYGKYTGEALDVLFTTKPYLNEYSEEENLGYPITTNNLEVIIDCLPDYEYEDSISNNIYHLEKCMDEYFDDEMSAELAIELIDLQWYEYSSEMIEVDEQEYIDLYTYIARLYIKTFVNENMSYNEIMEIEKELEERLVKGVKNESLVYTNIIEQEFLNYITEHNIIEESKKASL